VAGRTSNSSSRPSPISAGSSNNLSGNGAHALFPVHDNANVRSGIALAIAGVLGDTAQAKAACFDACHKAQEARDFVFSDPRR
jgi:hypothetical protein